MKHVTNITYITLYLMYEHVKMVSGLTGDIRELKIISTRFMDMCYC